MSDTTEPPAKKQRLEPTELEKLEVISLNAVADDLVADDFSQDVDTTDRVEKGFVVSNDKYNNFVCPAELDRLREFRVLDEVKSNDEDSNDEESESSDAKSEGLPEEELDRMLDEDLPEDFKAAPKPKEKTYITRQKIVLEEKGINQFEVLPLDWMMARHYSGMPIYMHRPTRVCTLSKPYFLGKGNTRRHDIPISALPCLAYRRALEEEEKQKEIDKQIDDQIKSGTWQQSKDKSKPNIQIIKNKIIENANEIAEINDSATVTVSNDRKEAKKTKCPLIHESFAAQRDIALDAVSNSIEIYQNGIVDDSTSNKEINNIEEDLEQDELTGVGVAESMEINLDANDNTSTLTCAENDVIEKHIHENSTLKPNKVEKSTVVEDNIVTGQTNEVETTESNKIQDNNSQIIHTDLNSTSNVEVIVDNTETEEAKTTESNKKQNNNSETNHTDLNSTSNVAVNVDNTETKEAKPTESNKQQDNSSEINHTDLNSISNVGVNVDTTATKDAKTNESNKKQDNNSEINHTALNSTSNVVEVNTDTTETKESKTTESNKEQDNNDINHRDLDSTEINEQYTEVPLNRQPVVLPGGIVMPPPRVETVSTSWKTQHLTHEQVNEYCKRLFKFKTVNIMHFKRWADRRKYTKARKTLQYPTLPEGTKLITIPAQPAAGQDNGGGKVNKRDWVMNMNGRSYLSVFHEYVRRALQKQPVYEFKQLENASTPYQATVYIGGMQYGVGHGSSKRSAKSAAARSSIHILIPEMRAELDPHALDAAAAPHAQSAEPDFTFFDYVGIEDPRITEFCAATCEPSPHAILRTCLLRNFGAGDRHIHTEMKKLEYQKMELTMKVGKHTATVVCKNKKTAKQRASQAILQALHPHVRSWGSLLRLYGSRSVKSCKEKKIEEQQITLLQDAARYNEPNYAVLEKLRNEMRKLRERDEAVVPIGTLLVKDDLPTHSGSNLNNVDL